jgi:hypothetical protein
LNGKERRKKESIQHVFQQRVKMGPRSFDVFPCRH